MKSAALVACGAVLIVLLLWETLQIDQHASQAQMQTQINCLPCSQQTGRSNVSSEDTFFNVGQGGLGELTQAQVDLFLNNPLCFDVKEHLIGFTGLNAAELNSRLRRLGNHHFEREHRWRQPQSTTELAWYYATSVDYLFANAVHAAITVQVSHADEPVLDFSGGVGNTVIYLAQKGIKVIYFGIGMIEHSFAEYRIHRLNLSSVAQTWRPYSDKTRWKFGPVRSLPQDSSLGAILAFDVLEHIPKYEDTVKAMVRSLRPGGLLAERSPFAHNQVVGPDLRVHVSDNGVSMKMAMGEEMKKCSTRRGVNMW
eukprot:CAMPEP_0206228512 /NCGR_PEP_ID=MMETSP0047_2-20121206/9208_1 /ASSEMBLY_ACC=CAM_ASM_000192 /TAXON_ID=195065 /ORGANISM="Chroomonas mesostigmatica_cf, Strain CCMP1168" /LENGTH=310 /DNA_ID=CAMNT_0053651759 /DNA_START=92 /DNA_END=1021 /DNA_ORIENTATION=-